LYLPFYLFSLVSVLRDRIREGEAQKTSQLNAFKEEREAVQKEKELLEENLKKMRQQNEMLDLQKNKLADDLKQAKEKVYKRYFSLYIYLPFFFLSISFLYIYLLFFFFTYLSIYFSFYILNMLILSTL
jgi:cellulose synthase/poly-beta-1,6-N-acetylglucosamine synthase-like glycosyltransferase